MDTSTEQTEQNQPVQAVKPQDGQDRHKTMDVIIEQLVHISHYLHCAYVTYRCKNSASVISGGRQACFVREHFIYDLYLHL